MGFMETTTSTTFTTRMEAAERVAALNGFEFQGAFLALGNGPVSVGLTTFTDNGAGMVKVETVSFSITREEWKRKPKDYRTGDPRKGTAKVLHLTDRGTCLVPVQVVG